MGVCRAGFDVVGGRALVAERHAEPGSIKVDQLDVCDGRELIGDDDIITAPEVRENQRIRIGESTAWSSR
jgi:hypothetical protein